MKKIPLSQGKFAIVDDEDYEFLNQWNWYYDRGYAQRNALRPDRGLIRMHRVILDRMGFKDFEVPDHINRNGIDNRKLNLRPATQFQNRYNHSSRSNNTSGYVGVCWDKQRKKWRARMVINKKELCLGHYKDKKEAALAYNEAAKKYHGEFAVLNEVT
jgi:hypothetical protein